MEHNSQNIYPEGFDANRVSSLLDSAERAEKGGNSRLAIHLYCAAFEASQENGQAVDERALSGLRQAWTLACKQGDRPTAETIFNDLMPYNTDEQTQAALSELQTMAMGQLGVKKSELEDMALAFAEDMRDAGIDVDGIAQRFEEAQKDPDNKVDLGNLASSLFEGFAGMGGNSQSNQSQSIELAGLAKSDAHVEEQQIPRYDNLAGFEQAKEQMRTFGIVDPNDTEMQSFMEQAEFFHGISGPVLSQNFFFVGPSREDIGIFAQATAHEIGWPVITMIVDVNELGDGTIKVAAPVKRSLFGPPRITDLPNPCILVIQNIDILQDLFWNEEQAQGRGFGPPCERHDDHARFSGMNGMPGSVHGFQQRSFQTEIISYLSALFARGGIFVVATSAKSSEEYPLVLSEQLESILGKMVEIPVDAPNLEERKKVIEYFSQEHPSFNDLDNDSLARLSEGLSRYELFVSCGQAVGVAYTESLKNQRHQMVSLEDVLDQFIQYLPQESESYRMVEDYLVALFSAELEAGSFDIATSPHQIPFDFGDDTNELL